MTDARRAMLGVEVDKLAMDDGGRMQEWLCESVGNVEHAGGKGGGGSGAKGEG